MNLNPDIGPGVRTKVREEALLQRLTEAEGYLNEVLDEYESATEELKATQEELTLANEELQELNHELAEGNDELTRLNDELRIKNRELELARDELRNMLRSAAVAIVVAGTDLRVRRFTPAAESILHLKESDVGRPLGELVPPHESADLERACTLVLENLRPQRRFTGDPGQPTTLWIRAYRALNHRIEGVVITAMEQI
jgi:two-component system CheB/CheR fusion protein